MEKLKIYKFQAKDIENTLRIVANRLESHNKKTSLDRDVMECWEIIKNVLNKEIEKPISRF